MVHIRSYFFVKVTVQLTLFITILNSSSEAYTIIGTLPEISGVLSFLKNLIGLNTPTLRSSSIQTTRRKNTVENVIVEKIAELKPYLQDDTANEDDDENNLMLERNDETTIIEFAPNAKDKTKLRGNTINTLKDNVYKYKKLRRQIKTALEKEYVSKSTANLVIDTLDNMIATIIENKCSWEGSNYVTNNTQNRVERATAIANEWNREWRILKEMFLKQPAKEKTDKFPGTQLYLFFEQFHEFLEHIVQDVDTLTDKYKMVCQVNNLKTTKSKDLRTDMERAREVKKKYTCDNFRVCAEELSQFMLNFYFALNETSAGIFKNYAAMYVRDVTTDDSSEKENVVRVLNKIGNTINKKISKIFQKETMRFKLDKNKDDTANLQQLRDYVKNTINDVKDFIKHSLDSSFKLFSDRLLQSIKEDLKVNLDIDLGNLEREFKGKICVVFSTCDGKNVGRRNMKDKTGFKRNNVYVKLQTLNDSEVNLKAKIALNKRAHNIPHSVNKESNTENENINANDLTKLDRKDLFNNVRKNGIPNVTRTTHIVVNGSNSNLFYVTRTVKNKKPYFSNIITTKIDSVNITAKESWNVTKLQRTNVK